MVGPDRNGAFIGVSILRYDFDSSSSHLRGSAISGSAIISAIISGSAISGSVANIGNGSLGLGDCGLSVRDCPLQTFDFSALSCGSRRGLPGAL